MKTSARPIIAGLSIVPLILRYFTEFTKLDNDCYPNIPQGFLGTVKNWVRYYRIFPVGDLVALPPSGVIARVAGEACHPHFYAAMYGAYETGVGTARKILAVAGGR